MGDMADFYSFGGRCQDPFEDLMELKDSIIYEKAKKIKIPKDYDYQFLCEKILQYYETNKKLSEKQKYALCRLIDKFGG